jgi:hypothetical protein
MPIAKKKNGKQKMAVVHHAHCAQKHGSGESHPLRTEKWPWYITPFAKKKNVEKQNGSGTSRGFTPIAKRKMAVQYRSIFNIVL